MPSPCDVPILGKACDAAGDAVSAAADSVFDAAAQKLAEGVADATKIVMTFWTELDTPELSTSSGPVAELQSMTYWLSGFVAVLAMLVAAGQMAWTRSGEPAGRAAKGLLTLVVASGAGVGAVNALVYFGDRYSEWILDRSADGDLGARLALLARITGVPGLGAGLVLIVGLVAILASLAQMGLMLVRIGVVTILAGTLPLSAAATSTATGSAWFQKVVAWLLAFVLYKPAAATVYASAFLLVGKGEDAVSVLSGLFLMVLAIVALPALLRLLTPAVAAAASSGAAGGAAAAAGMTAVASGARILADRGGRSPAPAPGPYQPGLLNGPTGGGPSGGGSSSGRPSGGGTVPGPRPGGGASSGGAGSGGAGSGLGAQGAGAATPAADAAGAGSPTSSSAGTAASVGAAAGTAGTSAVVQGLVQAVQAVQAGVQAATSSVQGSAAQGTQGTQSTQGTAGEDPRRA